MNLPRIHATPGGLFAAIVKLTLIAAVVVAITPPLRQRAVPHLAAAMNPIRRVGAEDRANSVARFLSHELGRTGERPQDRELPRVLERMYPGRKDAALDPWGRRYYLRRRGGGFQVGSAGPDQRRGTRDDVLSRYYSLTPPRDPESAP